IPVDSPPTAPLPFVFSVESVTGTVLVKNADAAASDAMMATALATPQKYLKLDIDPQVPTWVFHQREFSLPDIVVPEDKAVPGPQGVTVLRLPETVPQEVQRLGGSPEVSLWQYTGDSTKDGPLPAGAWQPALLLRFPLALQNTDKGVVYEVKGTPQ